MIEKKERILKAALSVFIKEGFAGASMRDIAKTAQVTQSLIYHHFKSKEALWASAKQFCVDEAEKNIQSIRHDSLENFVQDLTEFRFSVYADEGMRMLVHWQALEPTTSQFYSQDNATPHPLFDISGHIKTLQDRGIVRKDKDCQVLSSVIFGLSSYAFFDFSNAFSLSKQQQGDYKQLVCELLINTLKPKGNQNEAN